MAQWSSNSRITDSKLSLKPITLRGWVSNLDLKQLYKVILDVIVYLDWKYVTTCRRHQPP